MAGPSLILTGFMGTGKSSAGAGAARLLELPFLDTDAELRLRLGSPIRRVTLSSSFWPELGRFSWLHWAFRWP